MWDELRVPKDGDPLPKEEQARREAIQRKNEEVHKIAEEDLDIGLVLQKGDI